MDRRVGVLPLLALVAVVIIARQVLRLPPLTAAGVVLLAVWVWTIIDIIRTPDEAYRTGSQVLWLMVVLVVPPLGVPLYLFAGRPRPSAP